MITWIYGNTLPLAVQLHEVIYTQEGKTEQDYIPPVGSVIEVWAIGEYAKKQFDFTIDGNVVTFKDDGTLGIGTYGIRITVVEPESRRLRSFKCAEVEIIKCTTDLELGEFVIPDEAITLDVATFYWAKGDKGEKGDKGDQGIQGERGEQGAKGDKGERGEQGVKGDIGEKGDKGDRGERGLQGEKGEKGDTGVGIATITQNADYTITIALDDGTTYTTDVLRGATGAKGDKGDKGDTGNGIASAVLNADYTLTLTFTDGTTYTTPSIRGEKGEKGDKGDAGTTDYNELENKPDLSVYMEKITQEEFNEIFN